MSSITGLISGGGGGTPINGIASFAKSTNLFTDDQGQVWLNGLLTENLSSYPDADRTYGNISLAEFENKSFSVGSQEISPYALFFKDDGTRFYIVGRGSDAVFQYNLSTAWDLNTASYSGLSFSISSFEGESRAMCFGNNGTKMYIGGFAGVTEYTLSTAWQINTASFTGNTFTGIGTPNALRISSDGTKLFGGSGSVLITQTKLSTPFNLSSAGRAEYIDVRNFKKSYYQNPVTTLGIIGMDFNSNGTMMYLKSSPTDNTYQFRLMKPFDLSTAIDTGQSLYDENDVDNCIDIFLDPNGLHYYALALNDDFVKEYAIPEAIGTFPSDYNQYVRIK